MTSYKRYILGIAFSVSAAALLAAMNPAGAQTANAGAFSGSNSTSTSGSASGARAQTGNSTSSVTFNSPADTRSTTNANINNTGGTNNRDQVNYGGGTTNYSRNDGDVTVRTTPTVYAPPVSGGNPCTLAVSGGVSVIGWGAAAGGTFVDQDCANRQKIAMVHNAGYAGVAKELMCNDRDTYNAFKTAGQACAWRAAFEPPGVPAQPVAPVVVTPRPAVQPVVAAPIPSAQTLRKCRGANDQGPCFSG